MSDAQTTLHLPPVTSDTSQSSQEITPPRLPTPSQQKFCEPCKAFLRGDSTECFGSDKWDIYGNLEYIHHPDAESFQRALDLPCVICIRLYKAFQRASEERDQPAYSIGPTHYYWHRGSLDFLSDTLSVYPSLERYESRPDLHHQHITRNTGDARALFFLRKQYHECREQHSRCQRIAPYNDFTPTRAMYVGSTGGEVIRLCDRADMVAGASYTVLSHCWGKDPQRVMLKKSTEKMLKEGISSSSLPKTFQDAIVVTRMFKIQYIWIDSLCIFQDNLDDWAAEASRMRDVYSKAELCIAATGAEFGDVGLFFDRDPEQLTPIMVEATWSSNQDSFHWPTSGSYLFGFYGIDANEAVDLAPLNQRAWVAQERFLSPRILHLTQPLLIWECHTSFTCENDNRSAALNGQNPATIPCTISLFIAPATAPDCMQ
ncbi:hypothetical protein ACET3X_009523 [Alternaria dauci]|uniref:Heterokaryon incompatibility domain-containing protein n=1 Tax=Alternaria dauci TaxID=48095 RepID=A0ABR3U6L4_9PLEO